MGATLNLDLNFPRFTGEEQADEKCDVIVNYLYMLLEQFKYSMNNLGTSNFNDTEIVSLGKMINEPVEIRIEEAEGNIADLQVTATGIRADLETAEGNISSLQVTATGLRADLETAEGNISNLQLTATNLTSRMQDAEGNITEVTQTADGLLVRMSSAENNIVQVTATATSLLGRMSDAEENISTVTATAAGLTVDVSNVQQGLASLAVTVSGVESSVSTLSGQVTTVRQTAESITFTVTNGTGNTSTLNLYRDSVCIKSEAIVFSGLVTFSNLSTAGEATINGENLSAGTVAGTALNDGAVTGAKIASTTIDGGKLITGTITADQLHSDAVTAEKISVGAVTSAKISAGAITAEKISAGAITADMITAGTMSANRINGGTINANNVTITNLNASNISSGTLLASYIKLGGMMTVYKSVSGSTASTSGGYLGYMTGNTTTGATAGIGIRSTDEKSEIVATTGGSRIAYYKSSTRFAAVYATTSDSAVTAVMEAEYKGGSTKSSIRVKEDGRITFNEGESGFNTTYPIYVMAHTGNLYPDNPSKEGSTSYRACGLIANPWSCVCAQTAFYLAGNAISSDRNFKNSISYNVENYSAVFDSLKPCSFKYDDGNSGRTHLGFIAQEVEQAITDAGMTSMDYAAVTVVNQGDETVDRRFLRYDEIVPLNTYEIQKLKARVAELERMVINGNS